MTGLWKAILVAGAGAIFAVIVFFWVTSNQQKDNKKIDKQILKNEQKYLDTFGTDKFFVADKKKRAANAKKSEEIDKEIKDIDGDLKALDQTNKEVISDTHKALKEANTSAQKNVSDLDAQMVQKLKGGK